MRGVRNLSGLAGPGASLKDAGSGAVANAGISIVWQDISVGDNALSDRAAQLDMTDAGIIAGDLLVAVVWASGFGDDPADTYGLTELATSGWTQALTKIDGTGGYRIYIRQADGSEGVLTATGVSGGCFVAWVIRGAQYPTAGDIASWDAQYAYNGTTPDQYFAPLVDQTFDAVIMWHGGHSRDAGFFPKDKNVAWSSIRSLFYDLSYPSLVQSHVFEAPHGLGGYYMVHLGAATDFYTFANARIGLRKAV